MGELRDLFEDGTGGLPPSTEALERTRQRAERRARNRRLLAASVALALAATTLSGLWAAFRLGGDSRPAAPVDLPEQLLPTPSPSAVGDVGICPPPQLEARSIPSGVEPGHPQPGMGGGADPDGQFTNAVHFGDSPGPDGGPAPFIEIVRTGPDGGPLLPQDHARRFGEPIEVLGGEGYLVSIEDGWGVWFEHGDDRCNDYELHAYGPTKAETRRFAEGLAPAVRGELETGACPAPEVRATDLPPDFTDRAWPGAGAWAAAGTPRPYLDDAGAIHYRSADRNRFVEIRRRSTDDISLVHEPEGRLEVLGQPAISGPSLSSLSAYAVEFSLGAGRCPVHVVLGAGVTSEEVERFAEGLRAP